MSTQEDGRPPVGAGEPTRHSARPYPSHSAFARTVPLSAPHVQSPPYPDEDLVKPSPPRRHIPAATALRIIACVAALAAGTLAGAGLAYAGRSGLALIAILAAAAIFAAAFPYGRRS